jgi:Type VI secretion system/phage-baseplate injector OB domain
MSAFSDFVANIRKFGLEWVQRYYGKYPGIVVSIDDPEQRGRIQIQVPSILGPGITHAAWAEPHLNDIAGFETGSFFPPYEGDVVDVFFENGNLSYPRYKGGYWEVGELPDDFTASYGNVRGWVFQSKQKIIIDETEGARKIRIEDPSGLIIVVDETAGITIDTPSTDTPIFLGASGSEAVVLGNTLQNYLDQLHEALSLLIETLNNPSYAMGNLGAPIVLSGAVVAAYAQLTLTLTQLKTTFVDTASTNILSQIAFTKRTP